jgi:ApaG protein
MRLRLVDNMGAAIAFEHLNRHRAKFRKWHLSAWPTFPLRLNMTLPTVDRYQRGKDHDPKDENLSLGRVDKLFLPTHSVFSTQVEATKRLRSLVIRTLPIPTDTSCLSPGLKGRLFGNSRSHKINKAARSRGQSSATLGCEAPLNPQSWLTPRLCSTLLYMADRIAYKAVTRGIAVSVEPTYLEADSSPSNSQYLWAYRVIIENQGRDTVQLLSRHWMITNARGELTEVKGPGVIGKQPFLKPGESHAYTSGTPLNTPSGMMGGSYEMESDSGERFNVEIPTFSLDSPDQSVLLH